MGEITKIDQFHMSGQSQELYLKIDLCIHKMHLVLFLEFYLDYC